MRLGAKYRARRHLAFIYECTYVSTTLAVLRTPEGGEFAVFNTNWFAYEEVIEPRREFWNAYVGLGKKTVYRGPYDNRQDADHCICFGPNDFEGYYGVLELIHHSDNGTREGGSYKVESIFHMVAKK